MNANAPKPNERNRNPNMCPIPGCNYHYATPSKTGWFKHVVSLGVHPHWHPEIDDPDTRALLFRKEYPSFLPVSGAFARQSTTGAGADGAKAMVALIGSIQRDLDTIRARIAADAGGALVGPPGMLGDAQASPKNRTGT